MDLESVRLEVESICLSDCPCDESIFALGVYLEFLFEMGFWVLSCMLFYLLSPYLDDSSYFTCNTQRRIYLYT